jgi:AraC-like DNA-binding protein
MPRFLRTTDLEIWAHEVGALLLPMRGTAHPRDFAAELRFGEVGAVRVAELTVPAGRCARTSAMIGDANAAFYEFDVMTRGVARVEQDGRDATLVAGDVVFVDPARPATWSTPGSTHVRVQFPRAMLPELDARTMTAVRVPGDRGSGAMASAFARRLPGQLGAFRPAEAQRVGGTVVDLLGLAVSTFVAQPLGDGRRALVRHVYAFIEAHLGDAGLSPGAIAARHHISTRYLHKLFEAEQTTVTAWIRQRRLDRCRRDLLDPALREQPVARIGARWGMSDPGQFTRAFKAAHGVPPAAYRSLLSP